MTAPATSTNGRRPATGDRRAAARDAYRASLAAGSPLSGAALGRQFDMSERWGRDRVAEVQRDSNTTSSDQRRDVAGGKADAPIRNRPPEALEPLVASSLSGSAVDVAPATRDATQNAGNEGRTALAGSWLDSAIILAVAVVAAAASYGHMLEVAVWAGEPVWLARAFPLTVDGLVLAALRRGRQGRWWLGLGIAVSVAANMLARYPDLAASLGPVISAWPPLALFGTHRLLHAQRSKR